jgi:hypothetical protein
MEVHKMDDKNMSDELLAELIEDCLLKLKQIPEQKEMESLLFKLKELNNIQAERFEVRLKNAEVNIKQTSAERELLFKEADIAMRKKSAKIDTGLTVLKIGVEITIAVMTMSNYKDLFGMGLKFEETGSINSQMVKGLAGRFKPNN